MCGPWGCAYDRNGGRLLLQGLGMYWVILGLFTCVVQQYDIDILIYECTLDQRVAVQGGGSACC